MTMIERIAFAMFCSQTPIAEPFQLEVWEQRCMPGPNQWGLPDKDEDLAGSVAGVHEDHGRDYYRSLAKAAIEAMRKPSTWMLNEAVQISVEQRGNVAGFEYWQRMIDAALDEPAREAARAALKESEESR